MEENLEIANKIHVHLSFESEITSISKIHWKFSKTDTYKVYVHHIHIVIVRLFVKAKDFKQTKRPSIEEWLYKYAYNGESCRCKKEPMICIHFYEVAPKIY